jgi:hypothetical protein
MLNTEKVTNIQPKEKIEFDKGIITIKNLSWWLLLFNN